MSFNFHCPNHLFENPSLIRIIDFGKLNGANCRFIGRLPTVKISLFFIHQILINLKILNSVNIFYKKT